MSSNNEFDFRNCFRCVPVFLLGLGYIALPYATDDVMLCKSAIFVSETNASSVQDTGKVYEAVDEKPEYPEGEKALYKILMKKFKYPKEALFNGVQGTVVCRFIVERDGSISNPEAFGEEDGIFPLVAEVLRNAKILQKKLPKKFKPGMKRGEPVRTYCSFPIEFGITGETKTVIGKSGTISW